MGPHRERFWLHEASRCARCFRSGLQAKDAEKGGAQNRRRVDYLYQIIQETRLSPEAQLAWWALETDGPKRGGIQILNCERAFSGDPSSWR